MTHINIKRRFLGAAALAAAPLAGCNNDASAPLPTSAPPAAADFSAYATQIFAAAANSTPVTVDLDITYDVNDNPTEFNALIAAGTI
jgi:hypothetical protein